MRKMPIMLTLCLALSALASVSHAEALNNWTVPGNPVTDANTDHPKFGTANLRIYSALATPFKLENVGDIITFSGTANFQFAAGATVSANNFRWGLFDGNGSTNENGWSGYLVRAANSSAAPVDLYEKNGGGHWATGLGSANGYTTIPSGDITGGVSGAQLASGTYSITFSLSLQAEGAVLVNWSLVGTAAGSYALEGSWLDTSPVTLVVDRIALQTAADLGQTSIQFSDLKIEQGVIPESSTYALILTSALLVLVGFSRRKTLLGQRSK